MRHPLRPSDPRQIGRYRLIARLGQGGMGVVYLGHDDSGRAVAVKVLRDEFSVDEEFRGRFRSEVSRLRQVPPHCTAEVLDADPGHDPPYLVVEYIDGPSLTDLVRRRGPMQGSDLHSVALGIATALSAIHGARVVHRDLKPDNVLFGLGGVKVIDFGIARPLEMTSQHTRTGQMVGTVAYMAPERFDSGGSAHPAIDIFSWGAIVAYVATGRTPFGGESSQATAMRILTQPADIAGVPESLRDVVRQALDKDPQRRPAARELLDLLLPAASTTVARVPELGSVPKARAEPVPAPDQLSNRPRTRRAWWMAAAGAGLATLAALTAVSVPRLADQLNGVLGRARPSASPSSPPSSPYAQTRVPTFSFTYAGWSQGRVRVSSPLVVSTAYQMSAIRGTDDGDVLGVLTVFRPGAYDPETLTGAESTTIRNRPAKYDGAFPVPSTPGATNRVLVWQWADNAWAMVYAYSKASGLSIGEMRQLGDGLRTVTPTPARLPITMSYVPAGYRPVEVGSHAWATESGVVSINEGNYGGLMFARPTPAPVGLDGPWDPESGPTTDNFVVFVSPSGRHRPDGTTGCQDTFCYLYAGGSRVRIEVVSHGRLSDQEATKVLKGIKLADVDDDHSWTEATRAIPVQP